jgi:hypothetical protein
MQIAARHALTAVMIFTASILGSCEKLQPGKPADEARIAARERAVARKLQAACSSTTTYDRLKQVAFEEAMRIRNADPENLDRLATYSTVRIENPLVKSRDKALDVTVCSGRFVLDLPPGAERGFGGERRLAADIEYAAQMAADGSGLVYQIKGAEPIIYKLAAFDLRNQAYSAPANNSDTQVARTNIPAQAKQLDLPRTEFPSVPPPLEAKAKPRQPTPVPPTAAARQQVRLSSPSFNCRNAATRSERMVCGSDHLAALDRAMSSLYYSVMSEANGRTRAELRRSRDRFLAWRDRCSSEDCVAQAYEDRMAEIRDMARGR